MLRNWRLPWIQTYVGGILADIGLGQLVASYLARKGLIGQNIDPLLLIAACALIAIGSFLANAVRKNAASSVQEGGQDRTP